MLVRQCVGVCTCCSLCLYHVLTVEAQCRQECPERCKTHTCCSSTPLSPDPLFHLTCPSDFLFLSPGWLHTHVPGRPGTHLVSIPSHPTMPHSSLSLTCFCLVDSKGTKTLLISCCHAKPRLTFVITRLSSKAPPPADHTHTYMSHAVCLALTWSPFTPPCMQHGWSPVDVTDDPDIVTVFQQRLNLTGAVGVAPAQHNPAPHARTHSRATCCT